MEFAGDPEAIARDEGSIENDRRAAGVVGPALGLERRLAGAAAQIARLSSAQTHRGDGFAGACDDDAQLELEDLMQRRQREIGPDHLVAERRRQERPLEAHRMLVDQPQTLEHEHARPTGQPQRLGDASIRRREPRPQQARRDVLALGREIAGEASKLEDVVIDRRRGDERAEPVATGDEGLALEQLERLAQGHERHAEALRELALVIEPRTRWELADPDPLAQHFGNAVVAGHSTLQPRPDAVHRTLSVLELRASNTIAKAPCTREKRQHRKALRVGRDRDGFYPTIFLRGSSTARG